MEEKKSGGKAWIMVVVILLVFYWEGIQGILFSILYVFLPLPFQLR